MPQPPPSTAATATSIRRCSLSECNQFFVAPLSWSFAAAQDSLHYFFVAPPSSSVITLPEKLHWRATRYRKGFMHRVWNSPEHPKTTSSTAQTCTSTCDNLHWWSTRPWSTHQHLYLRLGVANRPARPVLARPICGPLKNRLGRAGPLNRNGPIVTTHLV